MEDLADGGVAEIVFGESVVRFGNLLGCGPGDDPELRFGCGNTIGDGREK
jgi:hypothetical protein